jgi:hypothetical protein
VGSDSGDPLRTGAPHGRRLPVSADGNRSLLAAASLNAGAVAHIDNLKDGIAIMNSSTTLRRRARPVVQILLAGTMILAAILVGSTAAQAATSATVTPAANAFAEIRNADTGLCIQAQVNAESPLVQVACNNNQAQQWIFVPNRNGNHIVNQLAGLCVYMNGPVTSGSPVIQTGCTSVTNEDWKNTGPPAVTTIMSRASRRDTNLCLAPESAASGALLRIFTCDGSNAQLWVIGV